MIKKLSILAVITLPIVTTTSIAAAQFSVVNNSSYSVAIKTNNLLKPVKIVNSNTATGLINSSDVYCSGDKITIQSAFLVPFSPNPKSPFANTQGKAIWDVNISCFGGINKTITINDAIGGIYIVTN